MMDIPLGGKSAPADLRGVASRHNLFKKKLPSRKKYKKSEITATLGGSTVFKKHH
jgi:hypothetical protein